MDTNSNSFRVVMFPWLAYGHVSPFLELAKKLSTKNFSVYFCSTPITLKPIKNKISNYKSIELVEYPLESTPEFPPHLHTSNGLPPHLMPTLKKYFENASHNFSQIIKTLSPHLVIYDYLMPSWVPKFASSHQIPAVHFHIFGVANLAYFTCLVRDIPGFSFQSKTVCLKPSEIMKLVQAPRDNVEAEENELSDCIIGSTEMFLIKSNREIEGKYLDFAADLFKKKIVPVGPLFQEISVNNQENDEEIFRWLNKKEEFSTVYVSFGTESYLSKKGMEELANGLELSKVNFIWVIKFPEGEKINAAEALPEGFLERVGEKGMIVERWVPQAKILGHKSIGGFVSHCGWSSVMESASVGVPIIALPMHHDQPVNARLVVEVGFGLEVEKDENVEFWREEVARVVKEVVIEKSGVELRKKAKELSEQMKAKGEEEVDLAIKELKTLCENNLGKYRDIN
uniref:Glycosyltransferase n=2 Tax=Panax notoginseng TaxID=44586 RepID=F4YF67_9APIA|nr:glycosyltransferase [Panax notoginseng]